MADKKKVKDLIIKIMPDEVIGVDISKSRDYKYASVGVRVSDNEYLRVSYEWKGDGIPDFVVGLMQFISANKKDVDKQKKENAKEYKELKDRMNR